MWDRGDNQEVGLAAPNLERLRNRSLVKWFRADTVAGLKRAAEAVSAPCPEGGAFARGKSRVQGGCWVGERPVSGEASA